MIKRRNMWLQVLWMILTFGFYSVYWYYATAKEMTKTMGRDEPVALWTVLLFLPPLAFYSHYKYGEIFELLTDEYMNRWVVTVLWIFCAPGVWFSVQSKLNELADHTPERLRSTAQETLRSPH